MIEIERKFLVKSNEFKSSASSKTSIQQGYLSKDPHRTVRVRIKNNQAFLTIKGISCLLYTSPSPRDMRRSRMPSSA